MELTYAETGRTLHRFLRADTAHFEEALRRLIIENEIYLVSRLDLNDPFDMRPILECDWTTEGIRQHLQNIFGNPLLSSAPVNMVQFLNTPPAAFKKMMTPKQIRSFKAKYPSYMNELLDAVGVCCFTEGLQNPLFWAHYAGSYKGVCVELKATSEQSHPFRNCMKVHYTDQRPTIFASQIGAMATVYDSPDWAHISQYGFCTKSTDWAVEKEWRLWIPSKARTYQRLPTNTLASIFLGPKSDATTRDLVCNLVRQNNANIKTFETSLSTRDFKVEIAKRII